MHSTIDQRLRPRGCFPFRRTPPLPGCARHVVSRLWKDPIRGDAAWISVENIGRILNPHPRYIRLTDTEPDIALSYWISYALVLDKPAYEMKHVR